MLALFAGDGQVCLRLPHAPDRQLPYASITAVYSGTAVHSCTAAQLYCSCTAVLQLHSCTAVLQLRALNFAAQKYAATVEKIPKSGKHLGTLTVRRMSFKIHRTAQRIKAVRRERQTPAA